jgi:hypothetical protein
VIGTIVGGLGGLAFILIGCGALIAPGISSTQYGLPTSDRTALALVRAIGARDLVLGIVILLLLATKDRGAAGLVLAVSVLAAVGDATAVATGRDNAGPRQLAVHLGGAAALLTAWALIRSGR